MMKRRVLNRLSFALFALFVLFVLMVALISTGCQFLGSQRSRTEAGNLDTTQTPSQVQSDAPGLEKTSDPGSDDEAGKRPLIGLSFDSLVVERWQRDMEIIVAKANEAGFEVNVQIANEDVAKQKKQINALLDEGVKVLIILPNDANSLKEELVRAERMGVKVIAYDRLINGGPLDLYVSFDNTVIGYDMTKTLLDALPSKIPDRVKNIVIINGDPKDNNSTLLNQGFYKAIDGYRSAPITVVHEVWALQWRERYAEEALRKVLEEKKDIDGVICANDALAASAIKVLAENDLAGKVLVVSQDAELSACQRIVEGTQLATVYKPINTLAERAILGAQLLIKGEEVGNDTIPNGYGTIPYDRQTTQVVSAKNIDTVIIGSGFHTKEDVYRHQ